MIDPRSSLIIACLVIAGLAAPVSAAGLVLDWKETPQSGNNYAGVSFSANDQAVFAGGSQLLVRSWSGDREWGGKAGTIAAMSADGNWVISANGDSVVMYDRTGSDVWTRNIGNHIRAVGISENGSFVVEADDTGLIQSWAWNGDFIGRNTSFPLVKAIAISRDGSLVVTATDKGLVFLSPALNLLWQDTSNGSLDQFIAISSDSSTVITAGDTRVSSHSRDGGLNWMVNFPGTITDMGCSGDCQVIVTGGQDGTVRAINRFGIERWTFSAGPWVNAVGVSRDGLTVAAGSVNRNLYVLDGGGNLLTTFRTDSIIGQRSVAVDSYGTRIAFADQNTLYGYTLRRDPVFTPDTVRTPVITTPAVPVTTPLPAPSVTNVPETTTMPEPTPTPESGLSPALAFMAAGGAILAARLHRKS
ncbi:MAG TPA: PQQ-binding-like beta-propeller repeat protein [Methanoregula sp.]|nr:PQQ-binding-like beta-propeller repeat protein [Methanoregula sp.]